MTTSRFGHINRRRLVTSTITGGAAILIAGQVVQAGPGASQPAALTAQDSSGNVPMDRGNAARTGEMPGPGPDDTDGVEVIWTFTTDSLFSITSPAVVNGTVYAGSNRRVLYAFNANDGSERWRFTTSDLSIGSPAVVDGTVYAGSESESGAMLYAVNADDGTERWRIATTDKSIYSPVVGDGTVYSGSRSESGGVLYALNADDGTERWRFTTTNNQIFAPAVVDGTVYAGSQNSNGNAVLYALGAPK